MSMSASSRRLTCCFCDEPKPTTLMPGRCSGLKLPWCRRCHKPSRTTAASSAASLEWICEVDRGQLCPYESLPAPGGNRLKDVEAGGRTPESAQKKMRTELEWVRSSPRLARQEPHRQSLAEQTRQRLERPRSSTYRSSSVGCVWARRSWRLIITRPLASAFLSTTSFSLPKRHGGVIGPNGVIKSTLFKAIGQEGSSTAQRDWRWDKFLTLITGGG